MGGYGSSRWQWHSKADTVEDSWALSVFRMTQEGVIKPEAHQSGVWSWHNRLTGEKTAALDYEVRTVERNGWLRLCYTITSWRGEKAQYDYHLRLQTTTPHFGGLRWWFTCPLSVNGHSCGRRVGKLYLPPGGRYYGCRHCHGLTYHSCQESDKRVSALRGDPEAILAALASSDAGVVIRALKAMPDVWERMAR